MAIAALAGTLILAAACKDNNNTTNTTSAAASPTAQTAPTTVAPTAAPSAPSNGATTSAGGPSAGGAAQTVTEVTTDNKFSVTSISAKVGQQVTVSVQNKGSAIHNFDITNASGAATGTTKTDFVNGGETKTATFTFTKAGTYKYQCDVHPTEMIGQITVTQ
jgi:plastocyanin